MSNSNDFLYTKDHEWLDQSGGDIITVGITDHAQQNLGDIVFVELPEVGESVEESDPIGSIESVKAVSEIFTPVKGVITEVNKELTYAPDIINTSPFKDGWIVKIKIDPQDLSEELMDFGTYQEFIEE